MIGPPDNFFNFKQPPERASGEAVSSNDWLETAIKAVEAEPELPGSMPDEMWNAIAGDRDATEEALRIAVRQTKAGIIERLLSNRDIYVKSPS